MSVGERLTLLRKTLEINQTDMAMAIGCSQANISKYEKDSTTMSIEFLIPLRKAYNVNLDWFLLGIGDMFLTDTGVQRASKSKAQPKKKDKMIKEIDDMQMRLQKIKDNINDFT